MKAPAFHAALTAGDVARIARIAQGMGLRETCRATGMSPTALSHFERNRPGTSVGAETLATLARVLMLDPWELMLRDGRIPPDATDAMRANPIRAAELLRSLVSALRAS